MAELILSLGRCEDLSGREFNFIKVNSFAGKSLYHATKWNCTCWCGKGFFAWAGSLKNGGTKSCGCVRRKKLKARMTTHRGNKTPEHMAWRNMNSRCYLKKSREYHNYGGRGITVCERWRHSFENFLADMGKKPSRSHSLDRFPDNNGNYEPGNVRWATSGQQARNKRSNRMITYNGITMTMTDWAAKIGVKPPALQYRLAKGWGIAKVFETPFRTRITSKEPQVATA